MSFRAVLAMTLAVVLAMTLAASMLFQAAPASARPAGKERLQRVAQERINALRSDNRVRRVRRARGLTRSASAYARYMLRRGYFGHLSTIRAPRRYRSLGEIILMHRGGHGRPRLTVNNWAGSPGHRYVMLTEKYRDVGVGKASGWFEGHQVTIWVAHFGRR